MQMTIRKLDRWLSLRRYSFLLPRLATWVEREETGGNAWDMEKWWLDLKEVEEYWEDRIRRKERQILEGRDWPFGSIHSDVHEWEIAKTGLFNIGLPWANLIRAHGRQIDVICTNAEGAIICYWSRRRIVIMHYFLPKLAGKLWCRIHLTLNTKFCWRVRFFKTKRLNIHFILNPRRFLESEYNQNRKTVNLFREMSCASTLFIAQRLAESQWFVCDCVEINWHKVAS